MVKTGEIEAGVKLQLVVIRFHIFTEFVKGFIVFFFF